MRLGEKKENEENVNVAYTKTVGNVKNCRHYLSVEETFHQIKAQREVCWYDSHDGVSRRRRRRVDNIVEHPIHFSLFCQEMRLEKECEFHSRELTNVLRMLSSY